MIPSHPHRGECVMGDFVCAYVAVLLIVCTPIGALIGYFARGRARDGAGLGFLLGVIGWFVILAIQDVRRRCSACRGLVPDYLATKCRYCGSDLPPEAPTYVLVPPMTPAIVIGVIVFLSLYFGTAAVGHGIVSGQFDVAGHQAVANPSRTFWDIVVQVMAVIIAALAGAGLGWGTFINSRQPPPPLGPVMPARPPKLP